MKKIRIALIGLGKMGKIHQRVLLNNKNIELVAIIDTIFNKPFEEYDGVLHYNNVESLDINNIDAVIISSTTNSHFEYAKYFIAKNIPTFIEKPISTSFSEVEEIINFSKRNNVITRCGLIEIYNPIFQHLKKIKIDDIFSIHIFRHSQKIEKERILDNVLYDLTLHDIAVIGFLFDNPKLNLIGKNLNIVNKSIESVDLLYSFNKTSLFISTSRESQIKTRSWKILTNNKLYILDLMNKKIDIYESGSIKPHDGNPLVSSKANHSSLSFLDYQETAQNQLDSFIQNIRDEELDYKHLDNIIYSHKEIQNILI